MAQINFTPPKGMELSYDQWGRMSASEKQLWLKRTGYFDQADAASARGDELVWDLSPSKAGNSNSNSQQGQKPAGGGQGAAGGLGGIAATEGVRQGGKAILGEGTPAPEAPTKGTPLPSSLTKPETPNLVGVERVTPVGSATMPDGSPGIEMSDGAIVSDSGAMVTPDGKFIPADRSPIQGGIQALGGAAQAYNGYRQWQSGQQLSGAGNMIGGAYNAYAGTTGNAAGAAPWVGAGVAAANVGQQMMNTEGNTADRAANAKTEALKAGMLAVPVYGQAAYAALSGVDALTGGKGTESWSKANKKLDSFNNKIDFGLQKSIDKKLFHQSTRGVQKDHTGQLLGLSEDPEFQRYVQGMRAQNESGPPDPSKPFHGGQYGSWDEYQKAGLDAADLTGVYGNIKAYGPEWTKLTEDQKKAVTQANIDSGLYTSKKGEVEITDEAKAKANFDAAINNALVNQAQSANAQSGVQPQGTPLPASLVNKPAPMTPGKQGSVVDAASGTSSMFPSGIDPGFTKPISKLPLQQERTSTRSPGINLDGTLVTDDPKKRSAQNRALMRR